MTHTFTKLFIILAGLSGINALAMQFQPRNIKVVHRLEEHTDAGKQTTFSTTVKADSNQIITLEAIRNSNGSTKVELVTTTSNPAENSRSETRQPDERAWLYEIMASKYYSNTIHK